MPASEQMEVILEVKDESSDDGLRLYADPDGTILYSLCTTHSDEEHDEIMMSPETLREFATKLLETLDKEREKEQDRYDLMRWPVALQNKNLVGAWVTVDEVSRKVAKEKFESTRDFVTTKTHSGKYSPYRAIDRKTGGELWQIRDNKVVDYSERPIMIQTLVMVDGEPTWIDDGDGVKRRDLKTLIPHFEMKAYAGESHRAIARRSGKILWTIESKIAVGV